jgi:hypothetical protein
MPDEPLRRAREIAEQNARWARFNQETYRREQDALWARTRQINRAYEKTLSEKEARRRAEKASRVEEQRSRRSLPGNHDLRITDKGLRIAVWGGSLAGSGVIGVTLVRYYPVTWLGLGILIGLAILAGFIAFKILASDGVQSILRFRLKHPVWALVIVVVAVSPWASLAGHRG